MNKCLDSDLGFSSFVIPLDPSIAQCLQPIIWPSQCSGTIFCINFYIVLCVHIEKWVPWKQSLFTQNEYPPNPWGGCCRSAVAFNVKVNHLQSSSPPCLSVRDSLTRRKTVEQNSRGWTWAFTPTSLGTGSEKQAIHSPWVFLEPSARLQEETIGRQDRRIFVLHPKRPGGHTWRSDKCEDFPPPTEGFFILLRSSDTLKVAETSGITF